jgi:hypothetical protein
MKQTKNSLAAKTYAETTSTYAETTSGASSPASDDGFIASEAPAITNLT